MSSEEDSGDGPRPLETAASGAADAGGGEPAAPAESAGSPGPAPAGTGGELHRLHWSSLFFDTFSHLRQYVVPAGFAFLGAARGDWFWGVLAIVSFGVSFLATLFRYFTLRYGIRDGELVISQGLIFRNVRTVPARRIQNMDLQQNVLHRIFGVAEVRIETASGSEAEAVLRVLTSRQIDELRQQVFGQGAATLLLPEKTPDTASGEPHPLPSAAAAAEKTAGSGVLLLRIPLRWLMGAGLASNRGWLLVGILIGLFFQFQGWERMDGRSVRKQLSSWIPFLVDQIPGTWQIVLLGLAGLVLIKLLGIAWFVLRFYGYQLTQDGEDLRVTSGLLTSYSATIPRGRVQFISVQRSLMMRWMGLATIRIETAGGAASSGEAGQGALSRSWFVPAIALSRVPEILTSLRPGLDWEEGSTDWRGTSPRTFRRLVRAAVLVAVPATVAGELVNRSWGWIAGLVVLAWLLGMAWRTSRSLRFARTHFGVVFRSGLLHRKLSLTFFDRVQTVRLDQSPFDRRWGMATLSVDTAAAGPADHAVRVPYLDEEFACQEFRQLQDSAALHRPAWK